MLFHLENTQTHSVCLGGLPSQENVDFLFDPLFIVGGVCVGGLLVDQTGEVGQLKNTNVIDNGNNNVCT